MKLPRLNPREPDSHKGHYGKSLLLGGSAGMAGAIGLAGMAALRGGAGLVTLAVPAGCQQIVASYEPSYMTWALPADSAGRIQFDAWPLLQQRQDDFTCWACGPGLGRSDDTIRLVAWLYENIRQPLILDADAIHALAMRKEGLAGAAGPRILTPHPGEFAYLKAQSWSRVPADYQGVPVAPQERQADEELAGRFAAENELVMVLKGHQTLVTDGTQFYHNETGNPGMATGGSGDVLTGLLTALVCQGLDIMSAACLGVHTHGRSGDLAAEQQGQVGMTARDLVDCLPRAIAEQVGG